jgi:hypothetical protein
MENLGMPSKLKTTGRTKRVAFNEKVALIGMGIKTCSSQLDRSRYFQIRRTRPKDEHRSISSKVYLEKHTDMAFDGIVEYRVNIEDKAGGAIAVNIDCSYQLHFHAPKGFQRIDAETFVLEYLPFITWPYFRQFVSDMSARMAIAPLTLPLLPEAPKASIAGAQPAHE